ncbi:MAG TPA: hypothetical protein VF245_12745 [Solirubrobacterales bacterium]
MATTAKWYGQALVGQFGGTAARRVDWAADTIKIALVKAAYTPDQDKHDFWDDVSANEVEGTNYTKGGKELTEKTVTYDEASNTVRLKAKTVEWKEVTVEYRYAVIYKDTGVAGTSPVLGYLDTGATQKITAGLVKVEWDATDGAFRVIVS